MKCWNCCFRAWKLYIIGPKICKNFRITLSTWLNIRYTFVIRNLNPFPLHCLSVQYCWEWHLKKCKMIIINTRAGEPNPQIRNPPVKKTRSVDPKFSVQIRRTFLKIRKTKSEIFDADSWIIWDPQNLQDLYPDSPNFLGVWSRFAVFFWLVTIQD